MLPPRHAKLLSKLAVGYRLDEILLNNDTGIVSSRIASIGIEHKAEKSKLLETAREILWAREEEELRTRYEDFWNSVHYPG